MTSKLKHLLPSIMVKYKFDSLLSGLILVLSPWFLIWFVSSIISSNSISLITPYWNDEISYWHEVLSFYNKGFNFGYYTFNELTPKLSTFGTHGFGTISIYSLYALLFGWGYNSIAIANTVFVSLSFVLLLFITKPEPKTSLKLSLLYLSFIPAILYCTSSMSELLNLSLLVIYFSLLYRYSRHKKQIITGLFLLVFVICISFVRVIYIVLLLPLVLTSIEKNSKNYKTILYFILWVILSLIIFTVNSLFVSPFPESFLSNLFAQSNFFDFIYQLFKNIAFNILRFFYPFKDDLIQVFQRYLVFILLIWLAFKIRNTLIRNQIKDFSYLNCFVLLFLALLITVIAYDVFDWRDFRVMAPFLFGVFVYLTLNKQHKFFKTIISVNVLAIVLLFLSPKTTSFFFYEQKKYTHPTENPILNDIKYDRDAVNPFKNTLTINIYEERVFLKAPAGIGINYSDTITDNLKSEYIYTKSAVHLKSYNLIKSDGIYNLYKKQNQFN